MLISKIELDSKGSRELIPLECLHCQKTHYRPKNTILRILNGSLKGTNKGCYCSKKCGCEHNKKSQVYICKQCGKEIERTPSQIDGENIFCSSSCSATYFNKDRIIWKNCLNCKNPFRPYRGSEKMKYCSTLCSSQKKRKDTFQKIENGEVNGHARNTLRKYLIHKNGQKCELCGITEWQGKPLVVIIDHISGNSDDNTLKNLRLVCSNCDANLPTYKSKNKGNGRTYRRKNGAVGG